METIKDENFNIQNNDSIPKKVNDENIKSKKHKYDSKKVNDEIIDESTENGKNKVLDGNDVDVDIEPKVGGNSLVIYLCSCFNFTYSYSDKK